MKHRKALLLSSILLVASVVSCAHHRRGGETTEYSGHYRSGFERTVFRPCPGAAAGDTLWWAMLDDDALDQFRAVAARLADDSADASGRREYYARVRGRLTARGEHGHLGHASRMILVDTIVELRHPRSDDCANEQRTAG